MTKSASRPSAGARAPDPAANPEPRVGSQPDTPATPPAPEPITEFEAPPALVPTEPGPEDEVIEVETTGEFMIVDPTTLNEVPHDKSAKVILTEFIKTAISDGRLKKA